MSTFETLCPWCGHPAPINRLIGFTANEPKAPTTATPMETTQHQQSAPDAWTPDSLTPRQRYDLKCFDTYGETINMQCYNMLPQYEDLVDLGLVRRLRVVADYQLTEEGHAVLQQLQASDSDNNMHRVIIYHSQAVSLFEMLASISPVTASADRLGNQVARAFGFKNWADAYRRTRPASPPTNGLGGTTANAIPPTTTVTHTAEPTQPARTPEPTKETDAEFLNRLAKAGGPNREEMHTESWRERLREIATHLEIQPADLSTITVPLPDLRFGLAQPVVILTDEQVEILRKLPPFDATTGYIPSNPQESDAIELLTHLGLAITPKRGHVPIGVTLTPKGQNLLAKHPAPAQPTDPPQPSHELDRLSPDHVLILTQLHNAEGERLPLTQKAQDTIEELVALGLAYKQPDQTTYQITEQGKAAFHAVVSPSQSPATN